MDIIKTPKLDNVRLMIGNKKAATGTLHITATCLIFVDPEGLRETWILYSHISSLERLPLTAAGAPLKIKCKNFQTATFVIARERDCADVYEALIILSNPEKLEDLYAFIYTPHVDDKLTRQAGWALFDMRSEYSRMGVPNGEWAYSSINLNYKICETYPRHLYVPGSASDAVLVGSSKFRSRGRLPALSYYHKETMTAICRCSQPLAGLNARCPEDEAMIQAVLKATPNSKYIYIVDTRPKLNALANRAAGKGYESTDFYDNVKFQFVGIENIHVMRQSLQKLTEVSETSKQSVSAFLDGQESSGWSKHIKAILDTSVFIVKAMVEEKVSVIVHCSDGWDRTAQTCSLASIILDPYCRTIHGFQVVIEKEWLSFGHKFTDRCGFLQSEVKETSPVFLQFLECTWQLLEQFPFDFQFNERFLVCLHDHAHSCQFGTFLGNCERERRELKISERTYSLWGYMWQNISDYINPLYREQSDHYLIPDTSPHRLKFWRSMYSRFDNDVHPREIVRDSLSSVIDHNDSLKDHIKLLQSRIEMFKTLLRPNEAKEDETPSHKENCAAGPSHDAPSLPSNGATSSLPSNEDVTDGGPETKGEKPQGSVSDAFKGNSGTMCSGFFQEISRDLKRQGITPQDLFTELPPFAMEWNSTRNVSQCLYCAKPIDFLSRKYHCWNCGKVFCRSCIKQQRSLPGHYSENLVPVCKKCHNILR